ncbi:MAG: FtsX-like permease family protein [Salinigranum sp.]
MSYDRLLVARWGHREWLSVLVVAVTTAFLVGSALMLLSAGGYTATLSKDLSNSATVSYYDSVPGAHAAASPEGIVIPTTVVRDGSGAPHRVVGIPPGAPSEVRGASVRWKKAGIPRPGGRVYGPVDAPRRRRLAGPAGATTATVRPHPDRETLFPDWWYVANASTVERLGASGAFVIEPHAGASTRVAARTGIPLVAALPFLLAGIRQVLRTLAFGAVAGGVVVLVLVYSVTRMAIRDRIHTIRIVRETGATPARVFGLLGARAALMSVVGVALGYGVGVVASNAAVNVAIVAGLPISLSLAVTPRIALALLPLVAFLAVAGTVAGLGAAVSAVRTPPARLGRSTDRGRGRADGRALARRARAALSPTILGWRAVIPTATTLAVFVFIVLLIAAVGSGFAPLASTSSGTIIETGAAHPINSRIDRDYATLLRSQGIEASPEVIYAQVRDGRPYLARGVNFTAFRAVTGARVVDGRAPQSPDEAVVGVALARTLGVGVGDSLTLGGSVSPGVRRVRIVGTFAAPNVLDDELLVPLATVRGLSTKPGTVHLIRTKGLSRARLENGTHNPGIVVTGVSAPGSVGAGEAFEVTVSVRNLDRRRQSKEVRLSVDGRNRSRRVDLAPAREGTVTYSLSLNRTGVHHLAAGRYGQNVTVRSHAAERRFDIPPELPDVAPPGATIQIPAMTVNGTLVANARVSLGNATVRSGPRGVAVLPVPRSPGTYDVRVEKPGYGAATTRLTVREGTTRRLGGRIQVSPKSGSTLTRPTVRITVANPWGRTLERNLTLVTPAGTRVRHVRLAPGNVSAITLDAKEAGLPERLTPGTYTLRLRSGNATLATADYRVQGDDRVFAVVASEGTYASGTGLGRAIESAFGNVQLLFGAMITLAGLSTVGGTTAAFARAVQARRRTIGVYRATGASRRRLLGLLLVDSCRLAVPATLAAVASGVAAMATLQRLGLLVVFGIRLPVPLSAPFLVGTALGAVALAVFSALVAGAAFLSSQPSSLLRD